MHDSRRYVNLAMAANSYRGMGAVSKLAGYGLILVPPLAALLGQHQGWLRSLLGPGTAVPLAVALGGVFVGATLVVRGIVLSANGEALLALADMAVAANAGLDHETSAGWARQSSVGASLGGAVAFVVLCAMAIGVGGAGSYLAAQDAQERERFAMMLPGVRVKFAKSSYEAEWLGESRALAAFGQQSARREFLNGEARAVDGRPHTIAAVSAGFATLVDAPLQYVPLSALAVQPSAPAFVPIAPGATVEFEALRLPGLHHEQDAAQTPPLLRRTFDPGDSCVVDSVRGHYFACGDQPSSFAPMAAARVTKAPAPAPAAPTAGAASAEGSRAPRPAPAPFVPHTF